MNVLKRLRPALIGLSILLLGYLTPFAFSKKYKLPTTTGTVISAMPMPPPPPPNLWAKARPSPGYWCKYEYVVDGKKYTSKSVASRQLWERTDSRDYFPGSKITVYYEKNEPGISYLTFREDGISPRLKIIGSSILAIGLLLFIFIRKPIIKEDPEKEASDT